ncbi:hypothetical protein GGS23DRAFT_115907 [Durotheca rogersii]|uniref:uncharacterized protein n=1 Tax=Durotheca rogersii TaxID=419775 RepID=UPI002220D127|nr:uncharacterized protein GGS23DRAFT_115907 [Durotheca rogersii]KAI5862278.1 hypothetical protein GGS23DRAFT_115907 [Durotheca rogersii]
MASYLGLSSGLGFDKNISYWTVPAALFMALLPRFYAGLSGPGKQFFDRSNPRNFTARLESSDLDKRVRQRLQRAEAAGANAFETLGLYAAAVTAGNAAGVPAATMNALSLGYLATRALYTWVYIWGQENRRMYPARTIVWFVNMIIVMTAFVQAGLRL